ncbi:MAG: helix-turn-helix domain-containing protein [Anaerolineaceae bacterium]
MENTFGDWLKQNRESRGLSQSELARLSMLNRAVINKLESGTHPTPDTLKAIARGLRISVENVYRAAGLLPVASKEREGIDDLLTLYNQLDPEKKKMLINYASFLNGLEK